MQVYIEPSGRRIAPFNDDAGDTLIRNRPLSQWQRDAIADAGLTPVEAPTPPCLIIPDNAFVTSGALRTFVQKADGKNAHLVVQASIFLENTKHVQPYLTPTDEGARYERIRFTSGGTEPPADIIIDPEEQPIDIDVPSQYIGDTPAKISLVRHPVMELHHWCHILWCNQIVGGIEVRNTPKWIGLLRVLWAALRALSINKWNVLGKLNRIGRGCDIHPTAVIEGCTLGDNVTVGPHARLLFTHVGSGATIMPGAQVELSVLGDNSIVSQACYLRFSVLYPEAVMSQIVMQQCILGRRAVTTTASWSYDLNFEQAIRVPLDGTLYSTGTRFLGSAFGHRSRIGAGFFLASGRMVPNDYFIIRDPATVVQRVPPGLATATPLIASGTGLRGLDQ